MIKEDVEPKLEIAWIRGDFLVANLCSCGHATELHGKISLRAVDFACECGKKYTMDFKPTVQSIDT